MEGEDAAVGRCQSVASGRWVRCHPHHGTVVRGTAHRPVGQGVDGGDVAVGNGDPVSIGRGIDGHPRCRRCHHDAGSYRLPKEGIVKWRSLYLRTCRRRMTRTTTSTTSLEIQHFRLRAMQKPPRRNRSVGYVAQPANTAGRGYTPAGKSTQCATASRAADRPTSANALGYVGRPSPVTSHCTEMSCIVRCR